MLPAKKRFLREDSIEEVVCPKEIIVNGVTLMTELAVQELGLATLPDFLVDNRIDDGELVEVLPTWRVKDILV